MYIYRQEERISPSLGKYKTSRKPDIIFIENVVGFEKSELGGKSRSVVVDMLNYTSNEYILDSVTLAFRINAHAITGFYW